MIHANIMNEPWKQEANPKKPVTEAHVPYGFIYVKYVKCPEYANPLPEVRLVVTVGWMDGFGGDGEWAAKWSKVSFWDNKML